MESSAHNPASRSGIASGSTLYADIFAHLDVGVAIYEAVGGEAGGEPLRFRFVAINPKAMQISRVAIEDVVGRFLTEVFPGVEMMGIVASLERVHRSGVAESLPPQHYVDDRIEGWYRSDVCRLDCGRLMVVYVDVTDDVQATTALEESETRYELLTESLADGIYDWDLVEDRIYFSPSWKAQLGYEDDELENRVSVWQDLLHPDQRERVLGDLKAFLDTAEGIWDTEFRLQHKNGRYLWIHSRATPVRDPSSGRIVRMLGVHVDIDKEKREREEVERHRATIDALFRALPDLFFLTDREGVILDFHASHVSQLYRSPEEFIGEPMQQVLPPDVGADLLSAIRESAATQQLTLVEYALPMMEGMRHYEGRIIPTSDDQFAILVRDITQRRLAEEKLEHRVRQNEALSQLYRVAQHALRREDMRRMAIPAIASGLHDAERARIVVEIDRECEASGTIGEPGRRIVAPIFDGERTRGSIEVHLDRATPPVRDDQDYIDTASQVLGVWLRGFDARRALETYERIVANTRDQLALLDSDLNYRVVNPSYAHRIGLGTVQICGRSVEAVLGKEMFERIEPRLRRCLAGHHQHFQEWRDSPDGPRYMNVIYSPYREEKEVCGVIVSLSDVSELHEAQAQLRRAARVFSSAAEAVMMIGPEGAITDVNPAFEQICGYRAADVIGRAPDMLATAAKAEPQLQDVFERVVESGSWRGEIWNRRKDGEVFPSLMTIAGVENERGEADGYVCIFSDISDIKEQEQRLRKLADHDALTGLPNRSMLARHLENRLHRRDGPSTPFTIMFLDLDHFKPVNDLLGHSAGDRLLQRVTRRLQDVLRVDDLLARVGGDEFVVLLPSCSRSVDATVVADKIIAELTRVFTIDGEDLRIGVSVGISTYPDDGPDADTLLRNADTAMYEAKTAGRNRWCCFQAEMNEDVLRQRTLITALSAARERGEQFMVYQPKFDATGERLVGLEALMRWTHPELGEVAPVEFIEAAEQAGFIAELDHWALDQVGAQLRRWRDDALPTPVTSVNISARTLGDPSFPEKLEAILRRHGVPGKWLRLEFSEAALMADRAARRSTLEALDALDVTVSIDHFGSGFSSLVEVTRFPVREIKIDAAFVRDATRNRKARSLVEAIIAIGRSLELEVVAEGIEDREHARLLEQLAPVHLQGFYFREPLTAEACSGLMRTQAEAISR